MNNKINNKSYFDTSTFIIVIIVIFLMLFITFTYKSYKEFQKKEKENKLNYGKPGKCPDYWEVGDDNMCKNVHLLGSCSNTIDNNVMNFDDEIFNHPKTGNYAKCKWAKGCNLEWAGINKLC